MGIQDRDWYHEDRGNARGSFGHGEGFDTFRPRSRRSASYHPLVLIAATLIGASLVWFGAYAYLEWRARVAIEQVMRSGNEAMQLVQQQVRQQQRDAALREQARREQLAQLEASSLRAARMRQEAEEATRKGAVAESLRRERAWAKFYRKPPGCSETVSMDCANGFIRAKRDFEERYARGEL